MVQLRPAQPHDLPELAALAAQLGYPLDAKVISGNLDLILGRAEHCLLVACDQHDKAIGWIHAYVRPSLASVLSVEIGGLVVASDWRGRGVGRRLVLDMENWARGQGIGMVRLRSGIAREAAHRFYQRLGYTAQKTQLALAKPL